MPKRPAFQPKVLAGLLNCLNDRQRAFGPIDAAGVDWTPLTWGLPYASILGLEFGRDRFGAYTDVTLRNRQPRDQAHLPHTPSKPYRMDPEAIALAMVVTLAGGTIYRDTASARRTPNEDRLDYLKIMGPLGLSILRFITDAPAGQVARHYGPNHRDIRAGWLKVAPIGSLKAEGIAHKGATHTRATVFDIALGRYIDAARTGQLLVPVKEAAFKDLFAAYARLLAQHKVGAFIPGQPLRTPEQEAAAFDFATKLSATHPGEKSGSN